MHAKRPWANIEKGARAVSWKDVDKGPKSAYFAGRQLKKRR